jgi:23S rRNA (pseudouridine1915-N3)-methyltransferase
VHIRLLAVGDRQPSWVDSAFSEYAQRLPRQWRFKLQALAPGKRSRGTSDANAIAAEGQKLLALLKPADFVVLLDEKGKQHTSAEFALRLSEWQSAGRDVSFIIGGPDGISEECRARSDYCWSLSGLTLPHAMARVLFVEQLYRAWSINAGHPYHRE